MWKRFSVLYAIIGLAQLPACFRIPWVVQHIVQVLVGPNGMLLTTLVMDYLCAVCSANPLYRASKCSPVEMSRSSQHDLDFHLDRRSATTLSPLMLPHTIALGINRTALHQVVTGKFTGATIGVKDVSKPVTALPPMLSPFTIVWQTI